MKPYPFFSLNHFTLPVGMKLPPSATPRRLKAPVPLWSGERTTFLCDFAFAPPHKNTKAAPEGCPIRKRPSMLQAHLSFAHRPKEQVRRTRRMLQGRPCKSSGFSATAIPDDPSSGGSRVIRWGFPPPDPPAEGAFSQRQKGHF